MVSGLLCPVTAVRFITLPGSSSPLLLSGAGDRLRVHSLRGVLLAEASVLPAGARVHGIEPSPDVCLLVRGGRWLAVVHVDLEEDDCPIRVGVRKELDDWVFAAAVLDDGTLAVALGHGQVQVLAADDLKCVRRARCDDTAISWAVALHAGEGDVDVAHAAADGTILLWKLPPAEAPEKRAPAARLQGHTGAAMSLIFSADGLHLASASVDRSVRLWRRDLNGSFSPLRAFYGHRARAWSVALACDDAHEPTIVSAGEDRTCRVWRPAGDASVLRGHAGRNVWCVTVHPGHPDVRPLVASGGEDGYVKLRALPNAGGAELREFSLPDGGGNPRKRADGGTAESARAMVADGDALVLVTDYGRVLRASREGDGLQWETLFRDPVGKAFVPNGLAVSGRLLLAGQTDGSVVVLRKSRVPAEGVKRPAWRFRATGPDGRMVMGVFAHAADGDVHAFVASPHAVFHWVVDDAAGLSAVGCLNEATAVFDDRDTEEGTVSARFVAEYRHDVVKKNMLVTSVAYLRCEGIVLIGDRGGRVTAYSAVSELWEDTDGVPGAARRVRPLAVCRPHSDRVSTLRVLQTDDGRISGVYEILSGAFDGRLARLQRSRQEASLTILSSTRSIEKVETLCKVVFPLDADSNQPVEERPCVVGFRSTDIVLWDLEQRNELFRWDVGSWRRAYDLDVQLRSDEGRLVVDRLALWFWRAGKLFLVEMNGDADPPDSTMVSVGPAFHGQRVNAIDVIPNAECSRSETYVITAGEDTVLRVMRCDGETGAWETHQTLTQHTSGVYAVSAARTHSGRVVAVSGGGADEVVVWGAACASGAWGVVGKVCGGAAVGRLENGVRVPREKEVGGAKHRVMSVACLPQFQCSSPQDFVAAVVGRSDGSVGLMRWSRRGGTGHASCELLAREVENRGAVLSVAVGKCTGRSAVVFSGDSGGFVCMWQIDVDDDGGLDEFRFLHRWRAHEGGVLSVSALTRGGRIFGTTGGDCGHVGVFVVQDENVASTLKLVSCSAISGVQLLQSDPAGSKLVLLATGGAQSVFSLDVHTSPSSSSPIALGKDVRVLATTGIVDASSISVVASSAHAVAAIVAGHGLEHIRLAIASCTLPPSDV